MKRLDKIDILLLIVVALSFVLFVTSIWQINVYAAEIPEPLTEMNELITEEPGQEEQVTLSTILARMNEHYEERQMMLTESLDGINQFMVELPQFMYWIVAILAFQTAILIAIIYAVIWGNH